MKVLECRFNDACTLQQSTVTQLLNDKIACEKVSDSQYQSILCLNVWDMG